jgi:hypothetical protein
MPGLSEPSRCMQMYTMPGLALHSQALPCPASLGLALPVNALPHAFCVFPWSGSRRRAGPGNGAPVTGMLRRGLQMTAVPSSS